MLCPWSHSLKIAKLGHKPTFVNPASCSSSTPWHHGPWKTLCLWCHANLKIPDFKFKEALHRSADKAGAQRRLMMLLEEGLWLGHLCCFEQKRMITAYGALGHGFFDVSTWLEYSPPVIQWNINWDVSVKRVYRFKLPNQLTLGREDHPGSSGWASFH